MFREDVDREERIVGLVEREHPHSLVSDPTFPGSLVCEVLSVDGNPRSEAERDEGTHRPCRRVSLEVEDEVDVGCQARVAVEHRRDLADHHVAGSRGVEGAEQWLVERHPAILSPAASRLCGRLLPDRKLLEYSMAAYPDWPQYGRRQERGHHRGDTSNQQGNRLHLAVLFDDGDDIRQRLRLFAEKVQRLRF